MFSFLGIPTFDKVPRIRIVNTWTLIFVIFHYSKTVMLSISFTKETFQNAWTLILMIFANFQMVHFQRVFSLVFRFVLTALCLGFSIAVSSVCFLSFKFNMRKVLISIQPKSKPRPPLNHEVNLNQDLWTFLQRPTNTKVVKVWNRNCLCFLGDLICFFYNGLICFSSSKVSYAVTETDDLPLFTVCPDPSLKWFLKKIFQIHFSSSL